MASILSSKDEEDRLWNQGSQRKNRIRIHGIDIVLEPRRCQNSRRQHCRYTKGNNPGGISCIGNIAYLRYPDIYQKYFHHLYHLLRDYLDINLLHIHCDSLPQSYHDLLPYWTRNSIGRASEDLIRRSWVETPPKSNFLSPVGTSKFPLREYWYFRHPKIY